MCQAHTIPAIDRDAIDDHLDLLRRLILRDRLGVDTRVEIDATFASIRGLLDSKPIPDPCPDDPNQNRLPFGIATIGG